MRHDQLLPIRDGEDRNTYVRRMADEFRRDVPLDELVDCAKSWWDVNRRMQIKTEILAQLDNPFIDRSVQLVLHRIITELL